MKLINKKTGEIKEWECVAAIIYGEMNEVYDSAEYNSIAKLNEEWEDAPEEEWRDVLGFEELYQVSNLGNVRTVKRGEATVMSQKEHWNGYLSVHLRNKGVERRASVHRLVAEAFIPNPDGLRDVNHKNGIKTDNRVENLEWLSHSDNMRHMHQMKKPTEPLIKDEKIRKAVRAWAEAFGVTKAYVVGIGDGKDYVELYAQDNGVTDGRIRMSISTQNGVWIGKEYTITELCGEEG